MKYKGFLSYSHDDEKFGAWLHGELEKYQVPKELDKKYPNLPKTLHPIFRDRYELSSGDDLGIEIPKALKNSSNLIVICSTSSANSKWVNKEILYYKRLFGEKNIFPIIINGEPFAKENNNISNSLECFPESLKYKINRKGQLTKEKSEILASNIIKEEDGKTIAKLKLISGILQVKFGDLYRRDQERIRKKRTLVFLFSIIIFSIVSGLSIFSFLQKELALKERNKAEKAKLVVEQSRNNANNTLMKAYEEKASRSLENGNRDKSIRLIEYRKSWLYALERKKINTLQIISHLELNLPDINQLLQNKVISYSSPPPHIGQIQGLSYSPSKNILATISRDSYKDLSILTTWDLFTGKKLQSFSNYRSGVIYSTNGNLLLLMKSNGKEMHLLNTHTRKVIKIYKDKDELATIVSFTMTDNEKFIVTGNTKGIITIWSVNTGTILKKFKAHEGEIASLVISSDSKSLITGGYDKKIHIWNISTSKLMKTFDHLSSVNKIIFDTKGKRLISVGGDNIYSWNIQTGERAIIVNSNHLDGVVASGDLELSPDGKVLAFSGTKYSQPIVQLLNTNNWKIKKTIKGHSIRINKITFSPDSQTICSGGEDGRIYFWNVDSDVLSETKNKNSPILTIKHSPDENFFATISSDGNARIWDKKKHISSKISNKYSSLFTALDYNPSGEVLTIGTGNDQILTIDTKTRNIKKKYRGSTGSIDGIAYSPDGKIVATAEGLYTNIIKLWDVKTGELLDTFGSNKYGLLVFSPNNYILAYANKYHKIILRNIKSKEERDYPVRDVTALAFNNTGSILAIATANKVIYILNVKSGKILKTLRKHNNSVSALAFNPDGKILASGSWDKSIILWDVEKWVVANILKKHKSSITALVYSPNGSLISASSDGEIKEWNKLEPIKKSSYKSTIHFLPVVSVAFSPDGKTLLSASYDGSISKWDTTNLSNVMKIRKNNEAIAQITYSPNGNFLAIRYLNTSYLDLIKVKSGILVERIDLSLNKNNIVRFYKEGLTMILGYHKSILLDSNNKINKVLSSFNGKAEYISFSNDKQKAVIFKDRLIKLIDISTNKIVKEKYLNIDYINKLILGPDSSTVIIINSGGNVIVLDMISGNIEQNIKRDITNGIVHVSYSANGEWVLTASREGLLEFWKFDSGNLKLKATITIKNGISNIDSNKDGSFFAVSSLNGSVRLLSMNNLKLLLDYSPKEVSSALQFLWELGMDEKKFDLSRKNRTASLFPVGGYFYSEEKFLPLLKKPKPNETKIAQLISWLEKRCAYNEKERVASCLRQKNTFNSTINTD